MLGAILGAVAGAALATVGAPPWLALPVIAAWAVAGWLAAGAPRLLALLPAIAVLTPAALVPGWAMLALAGLGSVAGLWAWTTFDQRRRADASSLRRRLRALSASRDAIERHLDRYPVLLNTCLELSNARDADQVAGIMVAGVRALIPEATAVRVHLAATDGPRLAAGDGPGADQPASHVAEELAYVLGEQRVLVRRDRERCRTILPLRVVVPAGMRSARRPLGGALSVEVPTDHLDDLDLDALHAAARLGGMGLSGAVLVGEARALALTDDLTGLLGQHEFQRRLDEQVAGARRRTEPLALIACDMDLLKRFNDAYGHAAGDRALLAVAAALVAVAPEGALAARCGGEEFALLLPGHDLARALAVARSLRERVAAATIDPANPDRRISISVGVAQWRRSEGAGDLLARADAACYRAKAAGRDRVEVAA